ncbi:MAG TPA: NAD(P)-dependent alcohol dehydrogenase [Pyrinomonadaceae bacterium]|nr:NAD(P)-dependent alcohol dehydrogenase [Acidobacteriota bacterium]HQZ94840.1 NAD(P)-dependent alcohol dehydrogenase [Pyrinomonadaceae bacterium]
MRAFEIQEFGVDKLVLTTRKTPEPGPNEVLVRLRAASLNYRDFMVVTGTYNPRMKFPAVPLSDGAGEVVALGDGVTKWKVGDRVMPLFAQQWFDGETSEEKRRSSLGAGSQWDGVLREYGAFNEESVVKIPVHLSFEEASTLPCAAVTAWNALTVSGNVKAGDTVLTLGTGGVSIFAVQIAKLFGARVIATSGSDEKITKLKELGANETINYRTCEDWDAAVLELTGKKGVDHVIEVGGGDTLGRSLTSVRLGGHVAMIGALSGPAGFNPISVFMKAVRLQGIFVGSRKMLEDLNKAIEVNQLRPVVDRVFGFEDAREALKYMESGSHFGKIVIKIGDQ